jgi:hypothetical protein
MAGRRPAETPQGIAGSRTLFQIDRAESPERKHTMKKQDIRRIYTEKVTELLNQGWTIFPDTMNGSQGEIAHIDLTDGNEIRRVLLERDTHWEREEGGYWGDVIRLTVGRAGKDTWVGQTWDGTVWNNRLEPIFQIEWAWLGSRRCSDWYVSLEEGRAAHQKQLERYRNHDRNDRMTYTELPEACKSAALRWVRKQPRMKTCRLEDIEQVRKVTYEGKTHYEIKAKGRTFRTDN